MPKLISLVLFTLMVSSSVAAVILKPTQTLASNHQNLDINHIIPQQFSDWTLVDAAAPLVNPQTQAAINRIYTQTLSRTYINQQGDTVMLSIAYGNDQSDGVGAHLPEGCYGGQGFAISAVNKINLKTTFADIPATRLVANKGNRIEPITYWLRTGNEVTYPGWPTKKLKLRYGFEGYVPDGLLLRVSSIGNDAEKAYLVQKQFVDDLLNSLSPDQRLYLIGYEQTKTTE